MKPVRDTIIVTDATKGNIITIIDYALYSQETLLKMIGDLFLSNIDNGILIKIGVRS